MTTHNLNPAPSFQDDGERERDVHGMLDRLDDVRQRVKTNKQETARLNAKLTALLKAGRQAQLTCDQLAHETGLPLSTIFERTGGKQGTRHSPHPKTKSAAIITKQTQIKQQLQALMAQIEENRRQGQPLKSEAEGLILDHLHDVGQRIKDNEQERARLSAEVNSLLTAGRRANLTCDALAREMGVQRAAVFHRTGGKQGIRGSSNPKKTSTATHAKQTKIKAQLQALMIQIEDNRRQGKLLKLEAKRLIDAAYDLGLTCRRVGAAMGISNMAVYYRGGKRGLKRGRRPSGRYGPPGRGS